MMELTGIAAVGFAFIASQSLQDMMEALIFFGGVGIISGPVVIGIERTMLRRNRRHKKRSIAFAVGSAYLIAIFFSGYFALMQFGPNAWLAYLHVILLVSLWGTVLICGTFAICLAWLRYWGWACVDRSMNH